MHDTTTIAARALKSLFPEGPAWTGMDSGTMRELSDGVSKVAERQRKEAVKIISDFFPYATELVAEWEEVFRLPSGELLTPVQRANRLAAAWSHISPGSFDGQNEIYALSGFNVYARPLVPGEDPRVIAASDEPKKTWDAVCGLDTICGEQTVCGDYTIIPGTSEVRTLGDGRPGPRVKNFLTVCGEDTVCGVDTICGDYQGYNILDPEFIIPDDDWTWPMIYIIEDFSGNFAHVPYQLKNAFDFLTFKIKPQFMWAIVRVEFA